VSEIWITKWRRNSSEEMTDKHDLTAFREAFPKRAVSGPSFAVGTLSRE